MPSTDVALCFGGPNDGGLLTIPNVPGIFTTDFISSIPMDKSDTIAKVRKGSRFAIYLWKHISRKFHYVKIIVVDSKEDLLNQITQIGKGVT
jgi:hypothetical protein